VTKGLEDSPFSGRGIFTTITTVGVEPYQLESSQASVCALCFYVIFTEKQLPLRSR